MALGLGSSLVRDYRALVSATTAHVVHRSKEHVSHLGGMIEGGGAERRVKTEWAWWCGWGPVSGVHVSMCAADVAPPPERMVVRTERSRSQGTHQSYLPICVAVRFPTRCLTPILDRTLNETVACVQQGSLRGTQHQLVTLIAVQPLHRLHVMDWKMCDQRQWPLRCSEYALLDRPCTSWRVHWSKSWPNSD